MNKDEVFIELLEELKNMKGLEIDNHIEMRGNLAFFVENYCETKQWGEIRLRIKIYCKNNSVNSFCWFLSQYNCYALSHNYVSKTDIWNIKFAELLNVLDFSSFITNNLRTVSVIFPNFYPNFFYEYLRKYEKGVIANFLTSKKV